MAHVVSITDGATTITFTAANGYQVEEYDPRTPEAENGDIDSIAETLQIYITGSSGGTVLDPFNGAGTMGVAALQNGAHYIGIEQMQKYVDVTHERLAKVQYV